MLWARASICVLLVFASPRGTAQEAKETTDLFALELIQADLLDAKRLMTIYDPDENGVVDKFEQEKLKWKDDVADFDLNKDGKLTHLEIAVRQAKLRNDSDITEFDINNVNKFLQRYDRNRNKQLEREECEAGRWPADFSEYDHNNDGVISSREMMVQFAFNRGVNRELGIEAIDVTGAKRIIAHFDKDNDKKLDADERANIPLPKPAEKFDLDDNGKLGSQELATMLAKHRRDAGLTKPDTFKIRKLFDRYDRDWDGRIDLKVPAETAFGQQDVSEQLKGYDTNKDGVVTIKEVEKVVAGIRKERGYTEVEFNRAGTMITRHDRNRDKHLEESELFEKPGKGQLPKSLIKQADLNDDGKVGWDELARHFAKTGTPE